MPGKKGKYVPKGSTAKLKIRCWFYEGNSVPGCPSPETCRYIHPWEADWPAARSPQRVIRCTHFNTTDGTPKGNGCPLGATCGYLHPSDPGWREAGPNTSTSKAPQPASTSNREPSPPPRRLAPNPGAGRCRFYDDQGRVVNGGCPWKHKCLFAHPEDQEWSPNHLTSSANNYKRIRCFFIGDNGDPLDGGCPDAKRCSFLHPQDVGWRNAPRRYKILRCENYDDNGNRVGGGCRGACKYIHPSDPEWQSITKRSKHANQMGTTGRGRASTRSPPLGPSRGNRSAGDIPRTERLRSPSPSSRNGRREREYDRRDLPSTRRSSRARSPDNRGRDERDMERRRRSRSRERRRRPDSPYGRRRAPSPFARRRSRSRSRSPLARYNRDRPERGRSRSPRRLDTRRDSIASSSRNPARDIQVKVQNNSAKTNLTTRMLVNDGQYAAIIEKLAHGELLLHQADKMLKGGVNATEPIWKALETLAKLFQPMSSPAGGVFDASGIGTDHVVKKAEEVHRDLITWRNVAAQYEDDGKAMYADTQKRSIAERAGELSKRLQRIATTLNLLTGGSLASPGTECPKSETAIPGDIIEVDPAPPSRKDNVSQESINAIGLDIGKIWSTLKGVFGLGA